MIVLSLSLNFDLLNTFCPSPQWTTQTASSVRYTTYVLCFFQVVITHNLNGDIKFKDLSERQMMLEGEDHNTETTHVCICQS